MKENLSFFPLETGYMLHFVIDFKEHGRHVKIRKTSSEFQFQDSGETRKLKKSDLNSEQVSF